MTGWDRAHFTEVSSYGEPPFREMARRNEFIDSKAFWGEMPTRALDPQVGKRSLQVEMKGRVIFTAVVSG